MEIIRAALSVAAAAAVYVVYVYLKYKSHMNFAHEHLSRCEMSK